MFDQQKSLFSKGIGFCVFWQKRSAPEVKRSLNGVLLKQSDPMASLASRTIER
jgi:hypothetical protein